MVNLHRRYEKNGVDFKLYSTDEERELPHLAPFLARHQAGFPPARVKPWATGELSAAMTSVGIDVGRYWADPLVALLDRKGTVVWQAQGVSDLNELAALLAGRVALSEPSELSAAR
ncbi:MAG: hypothetical protein ACREMA_08875 [Longimicrobiales bacterium]